ncbi:MAG: zinc ribbon domain-containing protein [bacterium]|nr:zinc ribbon domain-containing protein [bacterium]
MPTYEHICLSCEHEWDEFYSINRDIPQMCPSCNAEGQVKRLISGGSGRGIVVLTGRALNAHMKSEGRKMAKAAANNENLRANLIGEDRYHNQLLQTSRLTDDLAKIGKGAPAKKSNSDDSPKRKGVVRRIDNK